MKSIILFIALSLSMGTFALAQGDCQTIAQDAALAMAKVNQKAIGKQLTQIKSSTLVATDSTGSRATSHDIYAVSLASYGSAELMFKVKTGKDNDEVGLCSVESIEMEPVFY